MSWILAFFCACGAVFYGICAAQIEVSGLTSGLQRTAALIVMSFLYVMASIVCLVLTVMIASPATIACFPGVR